MLASIVVNARKKLFLQVHVKVLKLWDIFSLVLIF